MSARVAVSPLRVDAPGPRTTTDEDHALFSGRAPRAPASASTARPSPWAPTAPSRRRCRSRRRATTPSRCAASTQALVPRTVHVRSRASPPGRRREVLRAAAAHRLRRRDGRPRRQDRAPIVVDGTVLEARASGHRTLVLVDDKRGLRRRARAWRASSSAATSRSRAATRCAPTATSRAPSRRRAADGARDRERLRAPGQAMTLARLAAATAGGGAARRSSRTPRPARRRRWTCSARSRSSRARPPAARAPTGSTPFARVARATPCPRGACESLARRRVGAFARRTPPSSTRTARRTSSARAARSSPSRATAANAGARPPARRRPARRRCSSDDTLVFVDAAGDAVGGARGRRALAHALRAQRHRPARAPAARRRRRRGRDGARSRGARRRGPRARARGAARGRDRRRSSRRSGKVVAVGVERRRLGRGRRARAEPTRAGSFGAPRRGRRRRSPTITRSSRSRPAARTSRRWTSRAATADDAGAVAAAGSGSAPRRARGRRLPAAARAGGRAGRHAGPVRRRDVRASVLADAPAAPRPDGGPAALAPVPHTAPLVDAAGTLVFATADGPSARLGAGTGAEVPRASTWSAGICPPNDRAARRRRRAWPPWARPPSSQLPLRRARRAARWRGPRRRRQSNGWKALIVDE